MKPSALVSSSPGRAEKLPAPGLARLLRGKSTSRNRARSSPMFVSRSRSLGPSSQPTNEAGDPSSPKVTCIGQVRIRKKIKNSTNTDKASPKASRSRCRCLKQALLRRIFPKRKKKKICSCGGCRLFCCWMRRRKKAEESAEAAEKEAPPPPPPPPIAFVSIERKSESSEDEDEEETRVFVPPATANSSSSPPKNALLLMRCRSAPHNRSSALALCRFPVSPAPASESEEEREKEEERVEDEEVVIRERKSCNESSKGENTEESLKLMPAGLMRCNSEPAKKGEKLMEVGSCKGVVGVGPKSSPPPPPPPIILH